MNADPLLEKLWGCVDSDGVLAHLETKLIAWRGHELMAACTLSHIASGGVSTHVATSSSPRSKTSGAESMHSACPSHRRVSTCTLCRRAAWFAVLFIGKLSPRRNL